MRYRITVQLASGLVDAILLDDERHIVSTPPSLTWAIYYHWDDVRGELIDRCHVVVQNESEIP